MIHASHLYLLYLIFHCLLCVHVCSTWLMMHCDCDMALFLSVFELILWWISLFIHCSYQSLILYSVLLWKNMFCLSKDLLFEELWIFISEYVEQKEMDSLLDISILVFRHLKRICEQSNSFRMSLGLWSFFFVSFFAKCVIICQRTWCVVVLTKIWSGSSFKLRLNYYFILIIIFCATVNIKQFFKTTAVFVTILHLCKRKELTIQ